jgi:hypothetical protein
VDIYFILKGYDVHQFIMGVKIRLILTAVILISLTSCTTMHFRTIASPPPPAGKLRVAVLPITGDGGRRGWGLSHTEWSKFVFNITGQYLRETGVYDVVSIEEMNYVVGSQFLSTDEYLWLKNDNALIKQYGKALYADYAMIITRQSLSADTYKYAVKFVNVDTGSLYSAFDLFKHIRRGTDKNIEIVTKEIFPSLYKKLFSESKGDLLATAIRKGQLMPIEETKKPAAPETKIALTPSAPPPEVKVPAPTTSLTERKPAPAMETKKKPQQTTPQKSSSIIKDVKPSLEDKVRLVVYDFGASERLQVVSLILSEALREELFTLGIFSLINRENLAQVAQELQLQQSGLVDEKQIVKLGKWLAANEAVSGQLSQLGNSYILQAKRTDITTMNTLGFASVKCQAGQEDALLAGLPELARKIAGIKK